MMPDKRRVLREEAEEKIIEDICEGRENPPEQCYDSGAEVMEMEM